MTAPSLLDELEGVMAARAEWIESYSDTAWNELALLSVNFVSVNRTTLADMAKRLETAERGAARYQWLRDSASKDDWDKMAFGCITDYQLDAYIDAAAQEGE